MAVDIPGMPPRAEIEIRADAIRRVVRGPRAVSDPVPAGTLVQGDGRTFNFRALRWESDAVRLLLEDRPDSVRVAFAEIAELCIPPRDPGEAYLRSLAVLAPSCGSWLLRVETTSGLTATTSLERARARTLGDGLDPANWYFLIHPAWSLDALILPHGQIRRRIYFTPYEVPLDAIEPARGEPAPPGGLANECGWGLSVRAGQDVEFALPPCARSLRARVAAGPARGLVFNGTDESTPRFATSQDATSGTVVDTGRLALDAKARLIFRTKGAEGVALDWREPLVLLDPGRLRSELNTRAPRGLAGLDGWKTSEPPGEAWQVVNRASLEDGVAPGFRPVLALRRERLTLARTLRVLEGRTILVLRTGRIAEAIPPCEAEIRVDGRRVGTVVLDVSRPVVVDLKAFLGRELRVEVTLIPRGKEVLVAIEGAALASKPPEGGLIP